MKGVTRGLTLIGLVLAIVAGWAGSAMGQAPTITVQDTVYRADGTPAAGTVVVSWNTFTTAGGTAVAAGTTTVTLGSGGLLSVALVPNADSTPMGNFYTAVFHLTDGTTARQYWVIPQVVPGGGPAKLAAINNSVLPTSVAMQTVSKAYVDNAIAAAETGFPADTSPYVLKAGDTMTGPLVLPADPVSANQAADKNYVDENVAGIAAGLAQKVSLLPSATQLVSQPSGTQLSVNILNGELYANQYASGSGNNGIANALTSPDCASGCTVDAEPTYAQTETINTAYLPPMSQVIDRRGGGESHTAFNPYTPGDAISAAISVSLVSTLTSPQVMALRPGAVGEDSADLTLTQQASSGGSNQFPEHTETVPYGKSTYGALSMIGNYNTQGQHVQAKNVINCYAIGDCLAGSQYIVSSGGYRDSADEGAHPFDLEVTEDTSVFTGTCYAGCTTGSTSLGVNTTSAPRTQGDGRFLIDTNPAKDITSGHITGGGKTIFGTVSFSGTSFTPSTFVQTTQAATSQVNNLAPGTVTLPIATTGVPSGFATNTAALPSSGVACVADVTQGSLEIPNFEMANYSVVDGTHIQITLAKVHSVGATISVGGLCGYGLEQTADTVNGIRQLFPVVGSINSTSLYYADALTNVVGLSAAQTQYSTSGYLNYSDAITSLSRTSNVVTLTTASNFPADLNGLTLTISGAADSSYNGSYVVTTTGSNTLTYANTGANSTSSSGTISILTGSYVLYPMAEVISVANPTSHQVDGTMILGPNTVAWANGDTVEQPHYYQQSTFADTEFVTQYVPRPIQYVSAGKQYQGTVGPGVRGWEITNAVPASEYFGAGGTHQAPDDAFHAAGVWNNDLEADAGVNAVVKVHCNLRGCNRWDSNYALFDLESNTGRDFLYFYPQSDSVAWNLSGTSYLFTPSGFTAGTINAGTLNATTITGGVSGSSITSGTVSAARLPVFGPSGPSHAAGMAPDPGATAGSTRYLREDGTWATPAGGGSGSVTVNGQTCTLGSGCTVPAAAGTLTGSSLASGITGAPGLASAAGGAFGSAAFTASSAYDAAGAASSAVTTAEAYAANASNLSSGTVATARLPQGSSSAAGILQCGSGTTCSGGTISVSAGGTSVGGYLELAPVAAISTAASTTDYIGLSNVTQTSGSRSSYFGTVQKSGTITGVEYIVDTNSGGGISSSSNCTFSLYDLTTGATLTGTTASFVMNANTPVEQYLSGLSTSVSAGDQIQAVFTTPSGATTRSTYFRVVVYMQ